MNIEKVMEAAKVVLLPEIRQITSRLDKLEGVVEGLSARIVSLENRISSLENRMSILEGRFDTLQISINERFDRLVLSLNQRFDSFSRDVVLRSELARVEADVEKLKEKVGL
jgi:chromosome segregation ATPase